MLNTHWIEKKQWYIKTTTNSLPITTKKDVRENHHWQSSVASGDSWIIRIFLPYSYYPRIVLRDFFKVAKISTNRVRYVNRSYIRNEKWRHGYYTGLFWRLWADDMLINFTPEIDRFIFTFYVVFIISCILVSEHILLFICNKNTDIFRQFIFVYFYVYCTEENK